MEINLKEVRTFSAIILFQAICCLLSGFLFLLIFNRALFLTLDLFRLSVISIALASPILVLNSILTHLATAPNRSTISEDIFHKYMGLSTFIASLISFGIIYIPIMLGYFFSLSLKTGVILILAFQVSAAIILLIRIKKSGDTK